MYVWKSRQYCAPHGDGPSSYRFGDVDSLLTIFAAAQGQLLSLHRLSWILVAAPSSLCPNYSQAGPSISLQLPQTHVKP